ncbi:hypothetical protein IH992_19635 [Candidatus Poribacteria bacterium]|nr:hypothetical protein [Candidatus Poribacteria bacterium]
MSLRQKLAYIALGIVLVLAWQLLPNLFTNTVTADQHENKSEYLVMATGAPGFESPEQVVQLLETYVIPSFERLIQLRKDGKILAGGLPVGDRAFAFIVEASSNAEVDQLCQSIPLWGMMDWKVTPLHSVEGRMAQEKEAVKMLKESMK